MGHPVAEASSKSPFGSLSPEQFYAYHKVSHGSEFITNPRGLKLFTQWWIPLPDTKSIIGVVCVVHGFTCESSWFVQLTSVHIAKQGFAVCAIDHQGHGFSEGLQAHIPDINHVVDDCILFFDSFRERHALPNLPTFLYSESLGGAVALLITLRKDLRIPFDGVVLNAAMCGVSDKFKPPWPLEHFLPIVATLLPTWQVIPTRGRIPEVSFKVEWKKELAVASPKRTLAMPRAATAQELMRVSRELQGSFGEVTVPFLIVHGGDDVICDPACAEDLYKRAASVDKTMNIYPGMWHQLVGESDEDVERVFGDIVEWLRIRAERATTASDAEP